MASFLLHTFQIKSGNVTELTATITILAYSDSTNRVFPHFNLCCLYEFYSNFGDLSPSLGAWGSVVVKATSRTVPGSIPGVVTGFFSDIFPSDQTMALGLTQPVVKMNTRNIPGGKGGRCVRLTTYHHTVRFSRNLGALTS